MHRLQRSTILLAIFAFAAGCSDQGNNNHPADSSAATNQPVKQLNQRDVNRAAVKAALAAAMDHEATGSLHEAILSNEQVIEKEPSNLEAIKNLARIYAIVGQRTKAERLLLKISRIDQLGFEQLVLLTDFDRRHPTHAAILEECELKQPKDPAVNLGLAIEDFALRDLSAARRRLESVLAADPQSAPAQGLLGEILVATNPEELPTWYERIPKSVLTSAEVQLACGSWAQASNDPESAVRCFWEAARITPTSHRALYALTGALANIRSDVTSHYRDRSEATYKLRQNLSSVLNSGGKDTGSLKSMIELLVSTGRHQEAWGWLEFAKQRHSDLEWVPEMLKTINRRKNAMSRFMPNSDVTEKYPLDSYPLFNPTKSVSSSVNGAKVASSISFSEQSEQLGIQFEFRIGRPQRTKDVRMFESTGGGIAILDVENDGRPDLFFTQGLEWPAGRDRPIANSEFSDVLFRNMGERFQDFTQSAALDSDGAYGQGCSVGDINNDGFQDLYIANIGKNRLCMNNGDGTFTDVSIAAGVTDESWTTSCLIADIDGDGNPDLFDVNYLEGIRVFRDNCNAHACSTAPFEGSPDAVHWSDGDGGYTHSVRQEEGKSGPGLGIVAFRSGDTSLTESNETSRQMPLALYVGNDGKPDFLLIVKGGAPETSAPESLRQLTDVGVEKGLAVNGQGKYTSSMGIASGDINADGRLDFLVTNYSGEPNTLHIQQPGNFFIDAIVGTELYQPSLPYIGWGTQFLDADNDGRKDIIVVNGHVANFQTPGVEYDMPTHLFRQSGPFQFELLDQESVGPFFTRKLLGRSVVTLDWNLDGRRDLIVGTIESPAAVLTNTTAASGSFLSIRLHAVSTARDAIGAVVSISTEQAEIREELTAGDGYHASQERGLYFGLGSQTSNIRSLTIEWPGGRKQTLADVPINSLLEVTESHPTALIWQNGMPRSFVSSQVSDEIK